MLINTTKRFFVVALSLSGILLIADRMTKHVAPQYFTDAYVIIPHVLELSFLGNRNFLFYWQFPIWLVLGVISMVVVFLCWQLIEAVVKKQYVHALLFTIVFVGAASNIYDRLFLGFVIDFIRIPFWSVFNFADVYIIAGVLALSFLMWHAKEQNKEEKEHDSK